MLLLADRNFYGYGLWQAAAGTGADLLWRVKASLHLPVLQPLPDGSWLAHINDPRALAPAAQRPPPPPRQHAPPDAGPLPGITVRVIEFWLTVTADERHCPHRAVPADHHPGRLARLPGSRAGRRLRLAVGDRDRVPRVQDLPARPRPAAWPAPPSWPARNYGPTSSSTRPSAPSSPGRAGARLDPDRTPSPPPCTPSAAPWPSRSPARTRPWPKPKPASSPSSSPNATAASASGRSPSPPRPVPAQPPRPAITARPVHHHHPPPPPGTPRHRRPAETPRRTPTQAPLNSWHSSQRHRCSIVAAGIVAVKPWAGTVPRMPAA